MIRKTVLYAMALMMMGCATTGDPRQGGLFGWSEKKAVERQNDKHGQLESEKATGDELKATSRERAREKEAKLAELGKQRKRLGKLDNDIAKMEKDIRSKKNLTAGKQKEKKKAEKKLLGLKNDIRQLRGNTSLPIQQRKAKINILNSEIEKLLEIVANL